MSAAIFFFTRFLRVPPRSDTTRNNTLARYLEIAKDPCVRQTVNRGPSDWIAGRNVNPASGINFPRAVICSRFSLFLSALLSQLPALSNRAWWQCTSRLEINRQYAFTWERNVYQKPRAFNALFRGPRSGDFHRDPDKRWIHGFVTGLNDTGGSHCIEREREIRCRKLLEPSLRSSSPYYLWRDSRSSVFLSSRLASFLSGLAAH